jgi:predicted nucleic acid-binding Zn ribbon protein
LDQRVAESQILKVWQQVIDPVIAAHAQPAGLFRRTLFVNVDSSAWLSEIVRYRRREIVERIQHAMGKETVAKISFRVG